MLKVKLRAGKITGALAKKNLSQNWLARHIGISSGYMTQLLNGTRCPSPKTRRRFQEYFIECKFNDLFEIPESE